MMKKEDSMMARDCKVMIRLSEDVKNDLQIFAEEYGLSVSSFAAFVIGQYLRNQKKVNDPIIESFKSVVLEVMKDKVNSELEVE
jgi:antitoxin component of RelBE/YafQ-DinJ toxin-antitoxin module